MVYKSIIGRNEEIRKLEKFLKSPKSEFVAIYGRRRVGKSYLVEEVYKDKIAFRAIGSYIKGKDEKTYRQRKTHHDLPTGVRLSACSESILKGLTQSVALFSSTSCLGWLVLSHRK